MGPKRPYPILGVVGVGSSNLLAPTKRSKKTGRLRVPCSLVWGPVSPHGKRTGKEGAHLTLDRSRAMKMANEAVDQVRRVEAREHPELKRTRYCWLKGPEPVQPAARADPGPERLQPPGRRSLPSEVELAGLPPAAERIGRRAVPGGVVRPGGLGMCLAWKLQPGSMQPDQLTGCSH